jgi:alpha-beta hydrolase superfamily lysophospholipase
MIIRFLLYFSGFVALLVLSQNFHVFPGAFISKFYRLLGRRFQPPAGVQSYTVTTDDGKRIEIWEMECESQKNVQMAPNGKPYIALIFHGNAAPMESFLLLQFWCAELGIKSYTFDYRGYGNSTGWPSEQGIYRDSDAFWRFVCNQKNRDPENIIVIGYSLGGAPAARIAQLHSVHILLLVSAFSSVKDVLNDQILFKPLVPLLWSELSTVKSIGGLTRTALIIVHGKKDGIVNPHHADKLVSAYRGEKQAAMIWDEAGTHNTAFYSKRREIAKALAPYFQQEKAVVDES